MTNPFKRPWRVMTLIIIGPCAAIATAAVMYFCSPAAFQYEYTDDGRPIVHVDNER